MTKRQQRRRDGRRRQAHSIARRRRFGTGATLAIGASLIAPAVSHADPFVVQNTNDSGAGSLRQAILDASGSPVGDYDSIEFDPTVSGTIHLTSGEIAVNDASLAINGPGAGVLTIEQTTNDRIFDVTNNASISGLT